ncbi:hypothetical protein [Aquipluma nitroreducens]|uniref:hypothetical protein n=1 Tax=Aquipluma nitroreducens TaxID=2010828 RepID=UPI00296E64C2|nr:hypothetical protein [Aquipluma nitroreducens]
MINLDFNSFQKTIGNSNHHNDFSLDKIAKFFNTLFSFSRFDDNDEDYFFGKFIWRASESLKFNVTLHSMIVENVKGVFTEDQLCCIFQAFNGTYLTYSYPPFFQKESLFNYIDWEGQAIYDLGDVDDFKNKIDSFSSIEFAVFVDLIVEKWGYEGPDNEGLSQLLNFLKKE